MSAPGRPIPPPTPLLPVTRFVASGVSILLDPDTGFNSPLVASVGLVASSPLILVGPPVVHTLECTLAPNGSLVSAVQGRVPSRFCP